MGGRSRIAPLIERLESRRFLAVDLAYSSYLGGGGFDFPFFVQNLPSGDTILVGTTGSTNFTTTPGLDATFGGGISDAFVTRLHQSGTVMWSTYLGGDGEEKPKHIAIDVNGNLILSGSTKSTNFPTTAGLDDAHGGGWDGFITRIDPDTGAVVWSTYLGGSADEFVTAMPSILGDWYIAGNTGSADFPVSNGFDDSYGGGSGTFGSEIPSGDVFVGRIDLAGQVLSASFVGGSGYDTIYSSFALDPQGNLYVPMVTDSPDLAADGGFSPPNLGGYDGYLIKVAPSGARVWSARIGGSGGDSLTHLSVDDAGNVQVVGTTDSTNWPATAGMDTSYGGGTPGDVYLTVLNQSDGAQRWGTYIGGNGNEFPVQFMTVDGHIYGLIQVASTDLSASGGYDLTNPGGGDWMMVKYTTGGQLSWSTYIGGEGKVGAGPGLIRVNGDESVYFVGKTSDPNFSAVGGFDTTYGGAGDGVVVRIGEDGQRQWSTFVGGAGLERYAFFDDWLGGGYGFAGQDPPSPNDIIVYTNTTSADFATTQGFDSTYNDPASGFGLGDDLIVHLASNGAHRSSTYLGGSGMDMLDIRRTYENGDVLMIGTSYSTNFPVTANASDTSFNGPTPSGYDVAISRLSFGHRELPGLPTIHAFTDSPDPVAVGGTVTLSATASDPDGSVDSVSFYAETNGIAGLQVGGDLLLAVDGAGPFGVVVDTGLLNQVAGNTYIYYAHAMDDEGATSAVVSTSNTIAGFNPPPTITSFTDSPDPVAANGSMTLSAAASDSNGAVASISFYAETNGIAGLQVGSDTLLEVDNEAPFDAVVDTGALNQTAGNTYTYYAFATDGGGADSAVVSLTNTVQVPGPGLAFSSFDVTGPFVFFFFNQPLDESSATADDLLITNLDTGVTTTNAVRASFGSSEALFFFLPTDLPDGNYRFRLPAGAVKGSNGAPTLVNLDVVGPTVFFLAGDANHDQKVNIADYLRIDRGIARGSKGLRNGDFNYDGVIDGADYFIIDQAYLAQFGLPLSADDGPAAAAGPGAGWGAAPLMTALFPKVGLEPLAEKSERDELLAMDADVLG